MRERARKRYHAVSLGGLFCRVAQDWIIQLERFGEIDIAFLTVGGIATGGEIGGIKFLQLFAVRTERLALVRSAPGKRLGEPRDHHRLVAFVIGKLVGFAVAALERKIRSRIADLEVRRAEEGGEKSCHDDECFFHVNFRSPVIPTARSIDGD